MRRADGARGLCLLPGRCRRCGADRGTLPPSHVPPRPRAPRRRLYGLRAGPRCQSAAAGRAPGSLLGGSDTAPRRPLPAGPPALAYLRATAARPPAMYRPAWGRCGRRAGSPGGAKGRIGEKRGEAVGAGCCAPRLPAALGMVERGRAVAAEHPGGGARHRARPGSAVGLPEPRSHQPCTSAARTAAKLSLPQHRTLSFSTLFSFHFAVATQLGTVTQLVKCFSGASQKFLKGALHPFLLLVDPL